MGTAAQSRMSKSFRDAGGDASMMNDSISAVAVKYQGTNEAGKPDKAYTNVYKVITQEKAPAYDNAYYALHQQYHSMSADQKKTAARSLESGLGAQWDVDWKKFADSANGGEFKGTYKARTTACLKTMSLVTGTVTAGKGDLCQKAYTAAKTAGDKHIMRFFERKMMAALAPHVETVA